MQININRSMARQTLIKPFWRPVSTIFKIPGAAKIMIKIPSLQLARPVCWNASNPWPLVKCPLGRLDGQVSHDATGLHPIWFTSSHMISRRNAFVHIETTDMSGVPGEKLESSQVFTLKLRVDETIRNWPCRKWMKCFLIAIMDYPPMWISWIWTAAAVWLI